MDQQQFGILIDCFNQLHGKIPCRRDFFAGMALQGLLASGHGRDNNLTSYCFSLADGMIEQADKK